MPLRIAVDFDFVIHNPNNVKPGYKLGQPIAGAREALTQLREDGAIIVIHSVWADTQQQCEAMSKWCRYFDIPYDFITNQKPDCDVYLDDKAVRFYNWEQAMEEISEIHHSKERAKDQGRR